MAKKKKVPEPELQTEPPPQEALVFVRARATFHDGVFNKDFAHYGYKPLWAMGEIRKLPEWLFDKLNSR